MYKCVNDSPIVLNYIGDFKGLNNIPAVAVIGTREPTENGLKAAVRFGEIFGEGGFNVISGLAIGCDTGGHRGCLNKNGFTSAILAHGLDHLYPKENKKLADEIIEKGGVLISEYHVGQKPLANYFVERDRLQAGLSNGIIVVETDLTGGTMHTVKFASESFKRVAAFAHNKPEFLNHPKSQGNQLLITEKMAISLGTSDEIKSYMKLLLNDYLAFSKKSEYKIDLKKKNPDSRDGGTQLSFF
jgi:DNA processing protein